MIEQWNSLGVSAQLLLRGIGFLILCCSLALALQKATGITRRHLWQGAILGLLVLSVLALAPPLWDFKVQVPKAPPHAVINEGSEVTATLGEDSLIEIEAPIAAQQAQKGSWSVPHWFFALWLLGVVFFTIK